MGDTHFEIDTLKITPLSGGELSEIGLVLARALKRIEEKK